jgi:hypothetical protein
VTLPCKKFIVAKSKEVKTGSNLAESYKEGYGSKRAVLPVVMVVVVVMMIIIDDDDDDDDDVSTTVTSLQRIIRPYSVKYQDDYSLYRPGFNLGTSRNLSILLHFSLLSLF